MITAALGLSSMASAADAQTCGDVLKGKTGVIPDRPVRVIHEGTPAYASDSASDQISTLGFDTMLMLDEARRGRVKVYNPSGNGPVMWINPENLLCAVRPLRDNGRGPELKFFVRAPVSIRTASPTAIASSRSPMLARISPERVATECKAPSCQPVYRGSGLFVFSRVLAQVGNKTRERLLLGPSQSLDVVGAKLFGWVDAEDGFIWNTAYGIRPAEDLTHRSGPSAGKERPTCAYRTADGARASLSNSINSVIDDPCIPILGGARWYQIPVRIPVLSAVRDAEGMPQLYHVILNVAGQGIDGGKAKGWNLQTPFSPDTAATKSRMPFDEFTNLKKLDVLFVIDGTKSMEAHMDAVRNPNNGAIRRIATELQRRDSHMQSHYRFSALVYRDTAAGDRQFEWMALPNSCDGPSGADELIARLSNVVAADIGNDPDFPENSFAAIKRALIHARSNCPDRSKLVIVIGDHGYDAAAQQARGVEPTAITEITDLIKGNRATGKKRIVPIFIQAPSVAESVTNTDDYRRSYNLFTSQARAIVDKSLGQVPPPNLLLRLDSASLGEQAVAQVGNYSNSSAAGEVERRVLAGESLVKAIENAQGDPRFRNIPGLFWEIVKDGTCQALGAGCEHQTYDMSMEAYLPVSPDLQVDVHMTQQNLINQSAQFDVFLREFGDLNDEQRRQQIKKAMANSLTVFMNRPTYDGSEPIETFMTREIGLPIRERSPLLHYKTNDLADPTKVDNCELARIVDWVRKSKTLLQIAADNYKPIVHFIEFPGRCKGGLRTIPHVEGEIGRQPFPGSAGYRSNAGGQNEEPHFWIPQEFLP